MTLRCPIIFVQCNSGYAARTGADTRLAASPSTSSVRSSARRVRASASSFFRVKPSMSPRVSRAASSMSHRNASSRSSGFIEDFDVGLDRFPAVRILENLLARYIDLPVAEQGGKIILHLRNVPQRYLAPRLELDHEIDVARRAHIASRGGAEQAQFPDAVLSAQRCDFFFRDEQAAGRPACGWRTVKAGSAGLPGTVPRGNFAERRSLPRIFATMLRSSPKMGESRLAR